MLGLLLYLPLAFGGVMPLSRAVTSAAGAFLAAGLLVRCLAARGRRVLIPREFLLLAALTAWVAVQLLTLPAGWIEAVSPAAGDLWARAAEAAGRPFTSARLSVYPHATGVQLQTLIVAAVLMLTAAVVYRDDAAFRRLLAGVGLIGLVTALINVGHLVLGEERLIYGAFDGGATNGAPFASYSHFSEFINLSVGAAAGWLLIASKDRGSQQLAGPSHWPRGPLRGTSRLGTILVGFLLLGVITIALSTSRNGLISMAFAASVTAAAAQGARRLAGVGWSIILIGLTTTAALLVLGVDPVLDRFEAITNEPSTIQHRLNLIRNTGEMAAAFALAGAGLGTYAAAFPAFDSGDRAGTAEHAENQYVELLAELGLVGAILVAALLLLTFARITRAARQTRRSADLGLFGILFGLTALACHSLTDFGLVVPAVGLTAATLAGAAVSRAIPRGAPAPDRRRVAAGAALVAAVTLALTTPAAFRAATAWAHYTYAENTRRAFLERGELGSEAEHRAVTEHGARAVAGDEDHGEYRYRAAMDRWSRAVAEAMDFDPSAPPPNRETHPDLVPAARSALLELIEVLAVAPTHGPAWSSAGQLRRVWLDENGETAGEWILRARELARNHPDVALAASLELMRRGKEAAGTAELDRARRLGAPDREVVRLLAVSLERPEAAADLVAGDLLLTEWLLNLVRRQDVEAPFVAELEGRYESLLIDAGSRADASTRTLAQLARLERDRGRPEAAADLLRRALSREPASALRYEYARVLLDLDDVRGGMRELRYVLQFHPELAAAARLLEGLERDRGR